VSRLDVLVVPSIEDNSPNVIGEALMSGVKVIGSEVGGIAEIMKESNMSSFNPENPRDLVNILESFDFNYSRIAIAQNAKKIFSYEVIATKMLSFYHG
jgi:glycosyltransferase involved in cell wall biosynthesis